jgi:hypothetical protein
MALPKIELPIFETKLPSTNKKVKYRPFTVKEEKILLIAQESADIDQIILAIKQIINNCVTGVDVDKLALFDLEWLLMEIRSKSVNDVIEVKITDEDTQEQVPLKISIETLKVEKTKGHKTTVPLSDTLSAKMRYPSFDELKLLLEQKEEDMMLALTQCVEAVIEGDEIYKMEDFTEEEVTEFFESMTAENIIGIRDFFETMPKLRHELKYTNSNGDEKTFVVQGTETFFI